MRLSPCKQHLRTLCNKNSTMLDKRKKGAQRVRIYSSCLTSFQLNRCLLFIIVHTAIKLNADNNFKCAIVFFFCGKFITFITMITIFLSFIA